MRHCQVVSDFRISQEEKKSSEIFGILKPTTSLNHVVGLGSSLAIDFNLPFTRDLIDRNTIMLRWNRFERGTMREKFHQLLLDERKVRFAAKVQKKKKKKKQSLRLHHPSMAGKFSFLLQPNVIFTARFEFSSCCLFVLL
jgi:hypothetical protein